MTFSSSRPLKASVTRRQLLHNLPSASGIERMGSALYIISDDSPWLYVLDDQWKLSQMIALFTPEGVTDGTNSRTPRIPKKQKPDFEMMTRLQIASEEMLLVAGSGSQSPLRDVGYLIRPAEPVRVERIGLTPLYDQLRALPEVVGTGKLNLEGLAADNENLFFLQRGNVSGLHVIIRYNLPSFINYLTGQSDQLPAPVVYPFELPAIAGIRAGFSGATIVQGSLIPGIAVSSSTIERPSMLLFTASVEDTPDEINDGETLGSLVGFIELKQSLRLLSWAWITENEIHFTGKVESITPIGEPVGSSLLAIAVTDNDCGDSEILELSISW